MRYTVKPVIVGGCTCPECRAGRHLYFLYRCSELASGRWSGVTLATYASAQACRERHSWGIRFGPDDTWEDGTPIAPPNPRAGGREAEPPHPTGAAVSLNVEALRKAAELLAKHWVAGDSGLSETRRTEPSER
jgi:hypothetical protein